MGQNYWIVIQILPTETIQGISPEFQVSGIKDGKEVIFSPAGHFQLVDAKIEVSLLLLTDSLIDVTDRAVPSKKTLDSKFIDLLNKEDFDISHERALLIGIDVNDKLQDLDQISFFFDWKQVTPQQKSEYCKLLQSTHWIICKQGVRWRCYLR